MKKVCQDLLRAFLTDAVVSARSVLRQKRRSFAVAAAVTFGTVALILAGGFIEWLNWGMREGTIRSGLGHIQIVRSGFLEHGSSDPFAYLLPSASPHIGEIA